MSLAAGTVLPLGPLGTVEVAARAGFSHVGVRVDPASPPPGGWAAVRRRADRLDVSIFDVEVVRLGMTTDEETSAIVDAAATLGASWLLTVSHLGGHDRTEDALRGLQRACQTANPALRPALEFMGFTSVTTFGEAIAIADHTGCGIVADLLHLQRSGCGPNDAAVALSQLHQPCYLQLCDSPRLDPIRSVDALIFEARHDRHIPATGKFPIHEMLQTFPGRIPIAVEVQSDSLLAEIGPEALARRCRASVEALLGPKPH